MLNLSFLAHTEIELQVLTVCIGVNGEKIQSHTVTLTLVGQCPISNLSELFSYTTMYLNFMFLNQCLFELSCKNPDGHTYRRTQRP